MRTSVPAMPSRAMPCVVVRPGAVHIRGTVLTEHEYRILRDIAKRMKSEPEPVALADLIQEAYQEAMES